MQPRSHLPLQFILASEVISESILVTGNTSYRKTISRSHNNLTSISWTPHWTPTEYSSSISCTISSWIEDTCWMQTCVQNNLDQKWPHLQSSLNLQYQLEVKPTSPHPRKERIHIASGLVLCKETEGQGGTWDLLQHDDQF